jgi:transcriptional regulator of acetoin/glycerol metabolism
VPRLADLERALEGWHAPEDVSGVHADVEAMQLRALLAQHGGNKAAVARALGIDRTTLYRRLRRSS